MSRSISGHGSAKPRGRLECGNPLTVCGKAGATRAANRGATVAQLEAIFRWVGGKMASHDTRSADRTRLARDAISKLGRENEGGTSIVLPIGKVGLSDPNS